MNDIVIQILENVYHRVLKGQWIKLAWAELQPDGSYTRACLHKLCQQEIAKATKNAFPTPVAPVVFHAVWNVLPKWANKSIPNFNDAWNTTQKDILELLDKAMQNLKLNKTFQL